MTRARWMLVAIAACAIAGSPPARGQAPPAPDDAKAKAQELATSAKAHFDRGEYAAAVDAYRDAYRLWPSAGLLYNLGQAYRLAGDCTHAAFAYREYLHLQPDSPIRATVEQNLSAADACAKAAEPAPAPAPAPVPEALAPAPIAPLPDDDPGHTQRIAGLAIAGGGAILAAAGTYFAIDAAHAQRDVADFYARGGDWSQIADVDARGHRSHALAITGFALGGAALAAGVTLYMLGHRERAVAIVPARGGGEVVLAWRF
jgi:tetratricopeptide (TPR) repeat protein